MNIKKVFNTVGKIILLEGFLMLLPTLVSVYYKEACFFPLALTALGAFIFGALLIHIFKPRNHVIYAKEGFVTVALSWIALSLIGAIPFTASGEIPLYTDAVFETVSGFTTTGSSIIPDVESISKGLLFWRSFTHWFGGMGILVFVMAIVPNISDRSIHIMRAEVPGPVVGKLVPRIKDTAKILYLIYIVMTGVEVVLLCIGGMSLFESLVHSFGTAGTGGFGIKADGLESYSPYIQWVIAIFMLLFGINFNIYYLILIKRIRVAFKSTEIWVYLSIVAVSVALITANIMSICKGFSEALRLSVFQVVSIMTTTGYSTTDFNLWPGFSKAILIVLMFIGGCAGSTAGGLKVSRLVILFKQLRSQFQQMLHPRSVKVVKFEGKKLDNETITGVNSYFALYMICILCIFLIVSIEDFGFETNFSAVVSCFNNIGPGFGLVGPAANFSIYSEFTTIVLSFAMLLGRLEIFPILIFFSPATWSKKSA